MDGHLVGVSVMYMILQLSYWLELQLNTYDYVFSIYSQAARKTVVVTVLSYICLMILEIGNYPSRCYERGSVNSMLIIRKLNIFEEICVVEDSNAVDGTCKANDQWNSFSINISLSNLVANIFIYVVDRFQVYSRAFVEWMCSAIYGKRTVSKSVVIPSLIA